MKRLHISSPSLLGAERAYVLDALDKVELSWRGSYVRQFEDLFAEFCGVKYAVSCSNGTAGLHLALLALGVGPGDDVFLPALTYVATANAIRYVGATPIFCDVEPGTWTLDPASFEKAVKASLRPRAVLPVHLYGVPADMDAITSVAEAYHLEVVEDAAEAHGALYHKERVGSIGDLGVFSFFANKLLTMGEGGVLTTDDKHLAERAMLYRNQGQTPGAQFIHEVVGYNYRLTNLQAALGVAQLESYHEHARRHRAVITTYRRELRDTKVVYQQRTKHSDVAPWMFSMLLESKSERDRVMRELDAKGIETRPVFPPLTAMAPYAQPTPPVAFSIASRGLSLPTHAQLTTGDVYRVVDELWRLLA